MILFLFLCIISTIKAQIHLNPSNLENLCECSYPIWSWQIRINWKQVATIDSNTFSGFIRLQILNLMYNQITRIDLNTFSGLDSLEHIYLNNNQLSVEIMGRGYAWLDTGTHDSLLEAAGFISTLQKRQGLMVACPEEIAYRNNWITPEDIQKLAEPLKKNDYGKYLLSMLTEKVK